MRRPCYFPADLGVLYSCLAFGEYIVQKKESSVVPGGVSDSVSYSVSFGLWTVSRQSERICFTVAVSYFILYGILKCLFHLYGCFSCMFPYVLCMCLVSMKARRGHWIPWGWSYRGFVSHRAGAGNWTRSPGSAASALNHWIISLAPV